MTTATNRAIVHRFVEDAYNAGNPARLDELCAADVVIHDPAQPAVRDLQALKQLWSAQRAAFPDVRTTIEDLVAEGDRVAKRFTVRGTQTGEFNGLAPTGRQFALAGIDILRISEGKIREIWYGYDMLGVLQQLGVMPQPAAASV
jgi:steroid delta-isomerase-like uncharacterized protein